MEQIKNKQEKRAGQIIAYQQLLPQIQDTAYIAEGVRLVGDVRIGECASIWFNTVARGDVDYVAIGAYTNIQDNCTLHTAHVLPCIIGNYVTVGHGVILHGCTIADNCLLGMGAIVLNDVKIGENCIIAAGSLIPERKIIPPNSLVMGLPGKVVRQVSATEIAANRESALKYYQYACAYYSAKERLPNGKY